MQEIEDQTFITCFPEEKEKDDLFQLKITEVEEEEEEEEEDSKIIQFETMNVIDLQDYCESDFDNNSNNNNGYCSDDGEETVKQKKKKKKKKENCDDDNTDKPWRIQKGSPQKNTLGKILSLFRIKWENKNDYESKQKRNCSRRRKRILMDYFKRRKRIIPVIKIQNLPINGENFEKRSFLENPKKCTKIIMKECKKKNEYLRKERKKKNKELNERLDLVNFLFFNNDHKRPNY